MEWVNVIVTVLTSGLIISIVEFLYYKRFNKAIKKNEAESGDLDNQMKSINLGQVFLERIQAVNDEQQKLQEQQRKMWEEQDAKRDEQWLKQKDVMDGILSAIDGLRGDVENIKEFLNGEYKSFENKKKAVTKKKSLKQNIENKNE